MLACLTKAGLRALLLLAILGAAPAMAQAQALSDKELSQRINLKTYSDEEWDAAVGAFRENLQRCNEGNLQACVAAGDAYVSGDGTWPATPLAQTLYKEACDGGYGAGCLALGELAGTGYEVNDYIEPVDSFTRGCDLGNLDACAALAGELPFTDQPDAVQRGLTLLETSCDAGGARACALLGEELWGEDPARARHVLEIACGEDILSACESLTQRLSQEEEPDETAVAEYQRRACNLDSFDACLRLGERLYLGTGIARDRDLALTYYDKACQISSGFCDDVQSLRDLPEAEASCAAGDAVGCSVLGRALSHILIPAYDPERAGKLLLSSCREGIGEACHRAADLMTVRGGRMMTSDLSYNALIERGCDGGYQPSCMALALRLQGGPEHADLERAVAIFARLCDAGFENRVPFEPCELESRHYGYVSAARPLAADERFIPPQEPGVDMGRLELGCMTHPVVFRGETYLFENCPRVEKGINSYPLEPGQAPWQALLWRPKQLAGQTLADAYRVQCGGSLIATGWVLTAAHCLTDVGGTQVAAAGHRIRLGVYNPNGDEGVSYPILRTIAHPGYKKSNRYLFDIALIQYDHRAGDRGEAINSIRPIALDPLAVGTRSIEKGMNVYAYGWGLTEIGGRTTDYLQGMKMELESEQACTSQTGFTGTLANAALCAGGRSGEQACFGDSGGPLVYFGDGRGRPVLIGVVSAGKACGTRGDLSQYTRVAKARAWIDSYVSGSR